MSRNFELLRQVGKESELLPSIGQTLVTPPEIKRHQPSLEGLESDEMMRLVQRIFLLPASAGPRVVVFTSSESGSGCSWVCLHAAELLAAHVAGTVCLVDANLRSPRLHEHFGIENHYGLAQALQQEGAVKNYARSLSDTNLWLLSSGSVAGNWQSLFNPSLCRQHTKELRSQFDYVLIDTPPMSVSTTAIVLGSAADGAVLILKASSSRREVARRAAQDLKAANIEVLGAVLNQRAFPIPPRIYNRL